MQLYEEMLARQLEKLGMGCAAADHMQRAQELVSCACYRALAEIKAILEDDSLEDAQCFAKIERIVSVYESIGSSAGSRHDFG